MAEAPETRKPEARASETLLSETQLSETQAKLREQRNRFVAFAFAGADLMLEIGPDHGISYAAGISETFCALPPQQMEGRSVCSFVIPADRPTLGEALRRIGGGGRFDHLRLTFQPAPGQTLVATVSGINLGLEEPVVHLSISRLKAASRAAAVAGFPREPGQLVEPEDFIAMVQERIRQGEAGAEDYRLTLLDLGEAQQMAPALGDEFLTMVEGYLRAHSVGGTSVGRLHEAKFGVVSEGVLDADSMQRRINDIAQEIDPEAPPPRLRTACVDILEQPLSAQDLSRALVYTINKFIAEDGEDLSIATLADGYHAAMADTLQRVAHFRDVIGSDKLSFVYQPIVHLRNWTVHHYEALARIRQNGQLYLPSSFISFAEDVGVVNELDLVVCRRSIEQLRNNARIAPDARLAINLSGRSVCSPSFLEKFFRLLDANRDLMPRLLLEITESAEIRNLNEANEVIGKLRGMGCQTCLDDFGAGAAAFQYLRALEVDFVKIDGSYIMDAFDTHYGLPFLRAISALCRDMGIQCIGEMIEDDRSLELVREVGIAFGQGYHFCRPQEDVSGFALAPRLPPLAERAG